MRLLFVSAVLCAFLAGCASTGSVISKSKMGNLEINVYGPESAQFGRAELYLDGIFVGNVTRHMPVLHARRGARVIRVEAPGFRPYEKTVTVLGDPNHQALNVYLEKE